MTRWALAVLTAVTVATSLSACGSDSPSSASGSGKPSSGPVVVSAAASLQDAFTTLGQTWQPAPRFSFAGSDQLAAQIQEGVKPDVFASANTKLPDQLFAKGLVQK